MKLNEDVVLSAPDAPLVLVPYSMSHVPRYHAWMQSPELLELTASEPLSLSEEQENMRSWRDDPEKLTFIILDTSHTPATMAGDVNLYLLRNDDDDDDDDDDENAVGCKDKKKKDVDGKRPSAEVEVMIAEQASRRKGLAHSAVWLMMAFAAHHLRPAYFVAKIIDHNAPSIALFTTHLPFEEERRVAAFNEIHYRAKVDGSLDARLRAIRECWTVHSYQASPFSKASYGCDATPATAARTGAAR